MPITSRYLSSCGPGWMELMRLRQGQLGAQLYTGNGAEASLSDGGVGRGQGIISVMVDPAVDHMCSENCISKTSTSGSATRAS